MTGMIEKIYSEAMFEIGIEDGRLGLYKDELIKIGEILKSEPDLIEILSTPTIEILEKNGLIQRLFKDRVSKEILNLLYILVEKHRIKFTEKISLELKSKFNEYNGIAEMTITTVEPLKDVMRIKLIEKLEKTTGKKITLIEKQDSSIIGGIILNYGNTQMDSSIKTKLDTLRGQMKSIIA